MPIYAYECEAGHEFDLRQGFHDEPTAVCPTCEASARRRFHPATVIYKGSGFYTTDYARKSGGTNSDSSSAKKGNGKTKTDGTSNSSDSSSSKTKSSSTNLND
ncbi:MAG: FmdB family transcriptional regulator [Chloroflexi bacterium]|nr:FmdB family transcriptional regulator [Chloroflexota bacterium]